MKNLILAILFLGQSTFSQEIVWQKIRPCGNDSPTEYIHKNRLIEKKIINDTLNIKIGLVRNCSFNSEIKLDLKNDSLILEIQEPSGIIAVCECYFEINMKMVGIPDTNFTLYYNFEAEEFTKNGYKEWAEIKELEHYNSKYIFPTPEEINATSKLNQFQQDSLKIGLWEITNTNGDESEKFKVKVFYFIDSNGKSKVKWFVRYNKEGLIEDVCTSIITDSLKEVSICVENEEYWVLMDAP